MLIRPIEKTDYEQWLPLWAGYNAFYKREGPTAVSQEVTDTTWARFFDPNEPVYAFVAEDAGRLVGMTHYLFHRTTTSINLNCYLQDLFTLPDQRGKGVGRALIEAVHGEAKKAGSMRLYWLTQVDNVTARKLYDKVAAHTGFITYFKPVE